MLDPIVWINLFRSNISKVPKKIIDNFSIHDIAYLLTSNFLLRHRNFGIIFCQGEKYLTVYQFIYYHKFKEKYLKKLLIFYLKGVSDNTIKPGQLKTNLNLLQLSLHFMKILYCTI